MDQTDQYWYPWQSVKVLRSMYLALKSCVRTPEGITIFFELKQVPDRDVCLALFYLFYILVNL